MRIPVAPAVRRASARSYAALPQVHRCGSSSSGSSSSGRQNFVRLRACATALFSSLSSATAISPGGATSTAALTAARRWQSFGGGRDDEAAHDAMDEMAPHGYVSEDATGLQSELVRELEGEGNLSMDAALAQPLVKADLHSPSARIRLEKIERPPGRFDLLTNSLVYRWETTAAQARKVTGPMREWASELKYRTGVHMEVEPMFPDRLTLPVAEGGYASADEVELNIYLFGSERGIFNCRQLMEAALDEEPAYVRLGVFRRKPGKAGSPEVSTINPNEDIEWLMLRRINRDLRPPDIPPISLKLPGKWTLLFEHYKEAAIRTLWEETGITVEPNNVFPTGRLHQTNPAYYWRVPVHYFVAEVPYDVEVLGPQVGLNTYMHHWENQLLRQSPDPIDRAWAQLANPDTGCAWMKVPMIDELQRPLRGENYMRTRYTPPPYSDLNSVLGFAAPESEAASSDIVHEGATSDPAAPAESSSSEAAPEAAAASTSAGDLSESEPKPSA